MNLQIWCARTGKGDNAQIGYNRRICTNSLQILQIPLEGRILRIPRHNINGNVNPHTPAVGIFHRLCQFFICKIPGGGPHTESFAGQVHRVRSKIDGAF